MNMKQLLNEITNGRVSFQPTSTSTPDMKSFQVVITLILQAEKLGYITDVITHRESGSGNDFYDSVVVGGITKSGQKATV